MERGNSWQHRHGHRRHGARHFGSARDPPTNTTDHSQMEGRRGNPNRHPPGLKGRDIGMWHARRGRARREHAGRLQVTLDDSSVKNIQQVLNNHGNSCGGPLATNDRSGTTGQRSSTHFGGIGYGLYDSGGAYGRSDSGGAHGGSDSGRAYGRSDSGGAHGRSDSGGAYGRSDSGGAYGRSDSGGAYGRSDSGGAHGGSDSGGAHGGSDRKYDKSQSSAMEYEGCSNDTSFEDPAGYPNFGESTKLRLSSDIYKCRLPAASTASSLVQEKGNEPANSLKVEVAANSLKVEEAANSLKVEEAANSVKVEEAANSLKDEEAASSLMDEDIFSDLEDDELLGDFLLEYQENLLENRRSNEDQDFAEHKCTLRNDSIKNSQLKENLESLKKRNQSLLEFRKKLPAFQMQKDLLKVTDRNQVVVISGETGCGKTTQVTQFILDDMIGKGKGSICNIICTQPRRISAISVAERVAEERGERLGESVGYSIRLDHKLPRGYGAITYCTTGILLRRLRSDKLLTLYSHIIVDEVHERDIQTDFLLILLRDLLPRRPDLTVILMSATLNAEHFSEYFYNAAMFNIPGFTFPVIEYYLEDIIDTVHYNAPTFLQVNQNFKKRWSTKSDDNEKSQADLKALRDWALSDQISKGVSEAGINSIVNMNHKKIHPQLVARVVEHICVSKKEGAILVFLPGWADITEVNKLLKVSLRSHSVNIIPLHSMMPTAEQRSIFQRPPPGVRKIVLATNIAETSITIDDVVYVVNGGKIKMKDFITDRNMATLDSVWVSKANSRQRRGRAGRVQAGICYHLYTRYHESTLEEYQKPEMVRTRLENVCLDVKLLGQGLVKPFLLKAMNPPSEQAIEFAISLLKVLNAFDGEEGLTPLGYHLARMPLDPHTGKMVLMSAMFSCLEPVLCVAACLNFKDPFYIPLDKQKEVDEIRRRFSCHTDSDLFMYYYAVKGWEEATHKSRYCYDNFLSPSTITMISKMKKQFAELLFELKFISSPNVQDSQANRNSGQIALIRAILCAGLYPNVAKVYKLGREVRLSTKTEKKVNIHKKSVNSTSDLFTRGQWVIYYELIRQSGNVCVMDSTLMPAFPIMFFGGELKLEIKGDDELVPKYEAVVVDDWISFQCQWKNADLINKLRRQLNEVLEMKITSPSPTNWSLHCKQGATLQAIIDLLTSERTVQANVSQSHPFKAPVNVRPRW